MSRMEFDAAYGIQDPEAICLRFGLGFRAKVLGSRAKPNPTNLQNNVCRLVPYFATKALEEARQRNEQSYIQAISQRILLLLL